MILTLLKTRNGWLVFKGSGFGQALLTEAENCWSFESIETAIK